MNELPSDAPSISVVVPTLNSAGTLAELLRSLARQTFREFEVIVSDGGSRDASVELARAAAAGLPALRVDSRSDVGVYDAINRGVALARGAWVIVLGGDDRLHADDTLARAAPMLANSLADMVYGDVHMMSDGNGVRAGARYAGPMTLEDLLSKNICQQSIFYRRSLFASLGDFDLRYRIWADWDLNLRVAFRRPFEWIDLVVADYAATGLSSNGGDPLFRPDAPERLREELLLLLPQQAKLWPLCRRLLRHADTLRRHGRWPEAARLIGSYLSLTARRWRATTSS
jgi:glycosyltransferase involved in cell wall biosynthesis